jgi:hypothetical protein
MKRIPSIHRPHRWLALLCCVGLSPFPRAASLHAADPQPAEEPAAAEAGAEEEPVEAGTEAAPEARKPTSSP